jgi:hypothetical protein
MRIAISCFACPDFGRPTRRARFSSAPVDSGISEKSIRSSCVRLAFFRTRPARGDDTKRVFATVECLYDNLRIYANYRPLSRFV